MTGLLRVRGWLRRVAGAALSLVRVPSSGAPPPDIDGRRPAAPDPETVARVEWLAKDGRGTGR